MPAWFLAGGSWMDAEPREAAGMRGRRGMDLVSITLESEGS